VRRIHCRDHACLNNQRHDSMSLTARDPGTPQHQAASECDLFAPQWVGPAMGSRSGGIWEAQASKPGSPDRTTDHTPMRTNTRRAPATCISTHPERRIGSHVNHSAPKTTLRRRMGAYVTQRKARFRSGFFSPRLYPSAPSPGPTGTDQAVRLLTNKRNPP